MTTEQLNSAANSGDWTLLQLQQRWDKIVASFLGALTTEDIDQCLEHLGFVRISRGSGLTVALDLTESESA